MQTHRHKRTGTRNEILGLRGSDSSLEQMWIQQIQSLLKGFIRSASSGRKREREIMYDTNKALNVDVKKRKHQIVFYNVGLNSFDTNLVWSSETREAVKQSNQIRLKLAVVKCFFVWNMYQMVCMRSMEMLSIAESRSNETCQYRPKESIHIYFSASQRSLLLLIYKHRLCFVVWYEMCVIKDSCLVMIYIAWMQSRSRNRFLLLIDDMVCFSKPRMLY